LILTDENLGDMLKESCCRFIIKFFSVPLNSKEKEQQEEEQKKKKSKTSNKTAEG